MNTSSSIDPIAYSARHWWLSLLSGVLFLLAGFWVLQTPVESYVVLASLFSVVFLVNGIMEIYTALSERKVTRGWGWILAGGIIDLAVGSMLVANPAISLTVLPFVVGFGLMFRAMMTIGVSFDLKGLGIKNWGWLLALGIAGLLCAFILLRHPLFAGMTIVIWTAMAFFFVGVFRIWLAFQLKALNKAIRTKA